MIGFGVESLDRCASTEYDHAGVRSMWASSPPLDSASVAEDRLSAAEESAEQILNYVHPTLDSEERRRDVVDYIQQLFKGHLNCEVVSYGSVPLKTYLPEGDIDLTVLKGPNAEETLIHDVVAVIREQERNENAEYEVRETQFIDAEVKLVKCFFGDFVIDLSCNQLGGLSSLCFLEQVDHFVGRNHLFKRSIILIKTWCYYESRILGAHHGLISTYALEILILCIFHFFHASLSGPLSVLHRFLDYYGNFDWENYCISLKGPVHRSSLPEVVVNTSNQPSNSSPLLSEEFLESCIEMFSATSVELEGNSKPFQIKHLNIMDPLKENNNLGRSVNRGCFYRIRSAFKLGSGKLGRILSKSREEVVDEIRGFFSNTCKMHEHRRRSIMSSLALDTGHEESLSALVSSPSAVLSTEDDMLVSSYGLDLENDSVLWEPESVSGLTDDLECYRMRDPVGISSESCSVAEGSSIDIAALGTSISSLWAGAPDDVSSSNYSTDERFCGSAKNGSLVDSAYFSEKFHFTSWLDNRHGSMEKNNLCGSREDHSETAYTTSSSSVTRLLDNLDCKEMDSISMDEEEPEAVDALADLTGDYDNHIRSLLCGQLCNLIPLPWNVLISSPSPPGAQTKLPWGGLVHPLHLDNSVTRHQKARGIGTYFPKTNERLSSSYGTGRGRTKAIGNQSHFHAYNHHAAFGNTTARLHGRRQKPSVRCKSPPSGACGIEFGSLGLLGEQVFPNSTVDSLQKPAAPFAHERQSVCLELNEEEFPPLPIVSKPSC